MKRRWLIGPAVGAIAVAGIMGGTALAHGRVSSGEVASKVADALEIDEEAVQDALTQAIRQQQEEALQARLAALVEAGRITQEQADAYLEWYLSRPEGTGFGFRGHGFHRGTGVSGIADELARILGVDEAAVDEALTTARAELQAESVKAKLDRMVEEGRITQERADELWAQYQEDGRTGLGFGRFGRHGRLGHFGMPKPPMESNGSSEAQSTAL